MCTSAYTAIKGLSIEVERSQSSQTRKSTAILRLRDKSRSRSQLEQQSKDYQLKSSDLKARKPASRPQFSDCATNRDPDLNCIVFCVHQLTLFVEQQSKDYQLKSSDLKARKPASRPQFSDCATNRDPDLNCIVFVEQQSGLSIEVERSQSSQTRKSTAILRLRDKSRSADLKQSKDYQLKSSDLKARKPASRPQFSDCATNRDPDLNCIVFCVHQLTLFVEQQSKDYQLKSSDLKARKPASRPQFSDCATNRDPDLNCIVFVYISLQSFFVRKPASRPQFSIARQHSFLCTSATLFLLNSNQRIIN